MKRILTALVLIPLVLALVFLGPKWLFTLVTAGVAMLAAWEFLGMAGQYGAKPPRVAVLLAIAGLFAGVFEWPDLTAAIFGIFSLALLVYCTFRAPVERVMADATASVFCLLYCGFTLMALPALREQPNGPSLVAFLLCAVWAGDTVALYVGRAWGRHKLAPSLSPNKSWEGALGSVAGSLLATGILLGLANLLAQWDSARLSRRRLVLAGAGGGGQCGGAGGRFGRVRAQALRRRQGLRLAAAGSRRGPGSRRRPAAGRSGAMVRSAYSPAVLMNCKLLIRNDSINADSVRTWVPHPRRLFVFAARVGSNDARIEATVRVP
jgi:phosphatidate cytidylyltransferase